MDELKQLAQSIDSLAARLNEVIDLQTASSIVVEEASKSALTKQPQLHDRLISAFRAGAYETLKQLIQQPIAQILLESIRATIEV